MVLNVKLAVYFLKCDIIKKGVCFVVFINKVCSAHIEKKLLAGGLGSVWEQRCGSSPPHFIITICWFQKSNACCFKKGPTCLFGLKSQQHFNH